MKNKGTLIGATIRANDSGDQYPAALQNEIAGGRHTRSTTDERNAIGNYLRIAGMECYVMANGNTYRLENDLVTWTLTDGPGGGDEGGDNDTGTVQLISGNFGAWTSLTSRTTHFFDEQIELKYKADLQDFPTRAIVYLQGQFGLADDFTGDTITLGNIPANTRPAHQVKKYMICKNVEMYLVIETNGDVKLVSKDGIDLPTGSDESEDQPYYLDCFFQPLIEASEPTVYTASRSGDFTRNDCGVGKTGTSVHFSKDYTSTVGQSTADSIADASFPTDGQAYANDPANGATCNVIPSVNASAFAGPAQATGGLSAAVSVDVRIVYMITGRVDGRQTRLGGGVILVTAGTLVGHDTTGDWPSGTITNVVTTISNVTPNPAGGTTIHF